MSDSLSFDLIVRDHSANGLKKFADNLDKAGKAGKKAGQDIDDGMKDSDASVEKATRSFNALATAAAALGPAIVPVVAAAVPAIVGLTGALAGAGVASGVFGKVFTTTLEEVTSASEDLDKIQDKIDKAGQAAKAAGARGDADAQTAALKAQTAAQQEYANALALMPPKQRAAVKEYRSMTDAWQGFVDKNKPATYGILQQGYDLIKTGIGAAQPLFDAAAGAASNFLGKLQDWANGGGLKGLVDFLATNATQTFAKFQTILTNLAKGFGPLFALSSGQGQGLLTWITDLSAKLATFGQTGGWDRFMAATSGQGPQVVSLLANLATSLGTIVQAVTPLAPLSLAVATSLSAIIAAVPPPVITAIVAGFVAWNIAGAAYNVWTTLAAVKTQVWTGAQWLLNAALTANPIGLVVVAVGALIAVIVLIATKTTWFQDIWNRVWPAMKTVAVAVWNAIKFAASAVWSAISGYVKFNVAVIKTTITGAKTLAVNAWNLIKASASKVWDAITGFVKSAVSRQIQLFTTIANKARDVLNQMKSIFSPSALYNAGKQLIMGLTRGIASAMGGAVDQVQNGLGKIKNLLPGSPIKAGPLLGWNRGGAGIKLMKMLAFGIKKGSPETVKAMSNALGMATKSGITAGTVTSTKAATVAAKAKIARKVIRAQGVKAQVAPNNVVKGKVSTGGGSAGSGGGTTLNIYLEGTNLSTPEQLTKAVVKGMREAKANGYVIPFGTFQGGTV